MELWIRSQKKDKLVRVISIEMNKAIDKENIYYMNGDNGHYTFRLGEYEGEERAKEILDEIYNQHLFISFDIDASYQEADIEMKSKILTHLYRVYEMPKK